jgi:hypothetical protein
MSYVSVHKRAINADQPERRHLTSISGSKDRDNNTS